MLYETISRLFRIRFSRFVPLTDCVLYNQFCYMSSDLLGCHACLNVLHHYLLHNFIFSYPPHRAAHFFCQLCYFFFCKAFYYLHSLIFCAGLSPCWLNLSYFVIRLLASCNSLCVCHAIVQLSCIVVYDCKLLMKVIFKHCDCMTFVFYFFDDVLNFCFHIFLLLCRAFALLVKTFFEFHLVYSLRLSLSLLLLRYFLRY